MKSRVARILLVLPVLAGCAWRTDPQYSTVAYSLTGNAANLTVTAVIDEAGTSQAFSVAALPWSLSYDNETYVAHPPVYLHLVSASPPAILSGTATSASVGHLMDSGNPFAVAGVRVGDIALNTGSGAYSAVTAVTAADLTLTPGDDPFPLGTEAYEIYRMISIAATVTGDGNVIASQSYDAWRAMSATVVAENYTVP